MNTALIVEPRNLEKLPMIIEQFRTTLGSSWKVVFYCGKGLSTMWKEQLDSSIEIRELEVTNLNGKTYSDLLKRSDVWETLYGEFVLVFQADTWVMNIEPFTIDFFMKLNRSYIGGNMNYPWLELYSLPNQTPYHPSYRNFNGGLSLRKRQHMINIIKHFEPQQTCNPATTMQDSMEDVYFTLGCYNLGYPLGDDAISSHFAVHTIYHSHFFGIHQLNHHTRSSLLQQFPELENQPYLG